MYLVDTNVVIHLRDTDSPEISQRFAQLASPLLISLLSLVELEGGIGASPALASRRRAATNALLRTSKILPFDGDTVRVYGEVIAACGFSRARILDRLIAATAIIHDLTLVTVNAADFRDVPGLKLEIWPAPAQ